ncbi:MAG: hypothetical protein AAB592_01700 [Patescibacteria group bacterium]
MQHVLKNQRAVLFLAILDLSMGLIATYVDWPDFFAVPWYLVIFTPICPLYPLLLSANFFYFLKKQKFLQPLLYFTAIGIGSYGLMAFIFYPLYMASQGFGWYELGNIFWVTVYAAQFFIIFPQLKKIPTLYFIPIIAYFFAKDLLDRFGPTFSYIRTNSIPDPLADTLFTAIAILHIGMIFLVFFKSKKSA